MQVSFETKEVTKGMLRKQTFYNVIVTVQFNEEEKAIIKKEKLANEVVLECVPTNARDDRDPSIYYMRVKHLLKGPFDFLVDTRLEAQEFEEATIEKLRVLKSFVEAGSKDGNTSRTIEL